jgi:hypothetical protein
MSDDELRQLLDTMRQENSAAHEATRRHFDVVTEATKHEVRLVAESVAHVNEELERKTNALRQEMSRGFAETQAGIAHCGLRGKPIEEWPGGRGVTCERLEYPPPQSAIRNASRELRTKIDP